MNILIATSESGDWNGFYLDGQLIKEDHELDLFEALAPIKDRGVKGECVTGLSQFILTKKQMELLGNRFPRTDAELWAAAKSTGE